MTVRLVLEVESSAPSLADIEEFARFARVLGVPPTHYPFRVPSGHRMSAEIDLDRVILALENYDG